MTPINQSVRAMPDIAANAKAATAGILDWVGMSEITAPIRLQAADGTLVQSAARIVAGVNLKNPDVRGIHMSRLYLAIEDSVAHEPLSPCSLRRVLRTFLDSHAELSDKARVQIRFEHLLQRRALISENTGWRSYPVEINAQMINQTFELELVLEVQYSSTCPCSAALARQLIQEQFERDFAQDQNLDRAAVLRWLGSEQGIVATPHSQRSTARVRVKLLPTFQQLPVLELIDRLEFALKTPVQTAVKREDEQEFARLNGQNPMFCEDAARRLQSALSSEERIQDFWLQVSHFESLHAHDAVAEASKFPDQAYVPL